MFNNPNVLFKSLLSEKAEAVLYSDSSDAFFAWIDGEVYLSELESSVADECLEYLLTHDYERSMPKYRRLEVLLLEISHLGFGGETFGNETWRQGCLENVDKARKYMDGVEILIKDGFPTLDEDEIPLRGRYAEKVYNRQSLLLASCERDIETEAMEKLIHDYYLRAGVDSREVEDMFKTMVANGLHDFAETFVRKGIALLEEQIQDKCDTEISPWLCSALICLAVCINDSQRIERYSAVSIKQLELRLKFDCETDEQRYEVYSSLIADAQRMGDEYKTAYYAIKQREILRL